LACPDRQLLHVGGEKQPGNSRHRARGLPPTFRSFPAPEPLPGTRHWFTCRERVANGRNRATQSTGRTATLSGKASAVLIARHEVHDEEQNCTDAPKNGPPCKPSTECRWVFWTLDKPNKHIWTPEGEKAHRCQLQQRCLRHGFIDRRCGHESPLSGKRET